MPWINHLPPVCWSTFGILVWNDSGYVNLTQWWYFFIIFEYILHISTPHIMIFCFPLPYFLSQQVLYFLLSTLVLTLYIDVVLSLSILMGNNGAARVSHNAGVLVVLVPSRIKTSLGPSRFRHLTIQSWQKYHVTETNYRKTSNISRTLVGNKIVDNSDVVGASPVGAAPTTSSFST